MRVLTGVGYTVPGMRNPDMEIYVQTLLGVFGRLSR